MDRFAELLGVTMFGVSWIAGAVLAKGFWSTAAAICFPPYAWYLVVERGMVMAGWIGV